MNNYYQIDRKNWAEMTIFEQMGNIGSEVDRSLKAKRLGDDYEPALVCALDLFDASVETIPAAKKYRLKEILRARDQFLSAIYYKPDNQIEDYFMQFAIAARLHR